MAGFTLGNRFAREGCDRCDCGCKYWENDICIDCGTHVTSTSEYIEALENGGR